MNEADLRDRLVRAAGSLEVGDPPVARFVARGERRRLGRRVTAGVTALVVLAASSWALFSLRRLEPRKPADSPLPVVTHFDMGGRPVRPVAVGYGAAWFTVQDGENGDMVLVRIDQESGEITRVEAAGQAGHVTVGGGAVWTGSCSNPGLDSCDETRIVRIDPQTLEATAEIPVDRVIFGLAYGAGSVWVTVSDSRDGFLHRIDPTSNTIVSTFEDWACCVGGTAYGGGFVWSLGSNHLFDGELARLDPGTEQVTALPKLKPRFRFGGHLLAVGEGAVWVNVGLGGRSPIVRIDPVTGEVTHVVEDAWFGRFAAGEGGVWLARPREGAPCLELVRIDPANGRPKVVRVVTMGEVRYTRSGDFFGPSLGVGVGESTAWITIDSTWEVIRVDLAALGTEPVVDPACTPSPAN